MGAQVSFEKVHPFKLYTVPTAGAHLARAEMALTADLQRRHRILNGTASFRPGVITGEEQSRSQQSANERHGRKLGTMGARRKRRGLFPAGRA